MERIFIIVQFFFAIVIGLYFLNLLKSQKENKSAINKESEKEMRKLRKLREIRLSVPLSEKTRPSEFSEIIGQKDGLKALKAALCSPNPQHVIIYGPPGIGKTAAARVVLEEAKKNLFSPFTKDAKFIEMDATTLRFDERGIADPLMGSVHDPIYQGAGAMGQLGIPQPKPGAVTKAHGGILFLDEIGELHPIQMNKLLKVLEDRKVFLESSYYSSEDKNIPEHIHDIFQNGLPADFRLVAATTRTAEEIPPALRSRCVEVYFRNLQPDEIEIIARNAVKKGGFSIDEEAVEKIKAYSTNGREAVNMVQVAGGLCLTEARQHITLEDIEWVINSGHYSHRPDKRIHETPQVGLVNGLAVIGASMGTLIEIEATSMQVLTRGSGKITVTGIIDEEEMSSTSKKLKRKSTAQGSVENVLTVLKRFFDIDYSDYDIHLNFPGGMPIDGPSAGIAIAAVIYSSITNIPIDNKVAMTGEISVRGDVRPIGGVAEKIEAAKRSGCSRVIIPKDNYQDNFNKIVGIDIISVENIKEVMQNALYRQTEKEKKSSGVDVGSEVLIAKGVNSQRY